jgi:hypothetical protein
LIGQARVHFGHASAVAAQAQAPRAGGS